MIGAGNPVAQLAATTSVLDYAVGSGDPQTKAGWLHSCRPVTTTPNPLTVTEYDNLPATERAAVDAQRKQAILLLQEVPTPQMVSAHHAMANMMETLRVPSLVARPGLVLTGPPSAGKSTILTTFGRAAELHMRQAAGIPLPNPGEPAGRLPNGNEFLPVIYVDLSDQLMGSLRNILRFYDPHVPHSLRNRDYALSSIVDRVNSCGTRLVLLDQLQEVAHARTGAPAISGAIKSLMDRCNNTIFMAAGIGIEQLDILTDGHHRHAASLGQTGSRFTLHPVEPFECSTQLGIGNYLSLLATFDQQLPLLNHRDGDVTRMAELIFERTNGLTGHITHLIRHAACDAINNGTERLTPADIGNVPLAATAGTNDPTPNTTSRTPRRRAGL